MAVIANFEASCRDIKHLHCSCCRRVSLNLKINAKRNICQSCADRSDDPEYFLNKNMLPIWYKRGIPMYHVPSELAVLTHAEKMLIQRVSPFIPLHHIKQGTFGLSGHVCAFEQDLQGVADVLPRSNMDASVIKVIQTMQTEIGNTSESSSKAFKVRRKCVLDALVFLKEYSKEYSDIVIDESQLDWLNGNDEAQLEGLVHTSKKVRTNADDTVENADMGPAMQQCHNPRTITDEVQAFGMIAEGGGDVTLHPDDVVINNELQAAVSAAGTDREVSMEWPAIGDLPVNEYGTTRIFARAFPWLFPGGIGDIKDCDDPEKDLLSWGDRLLYYQDGRFAKDKMFCFFALNYISRHRNASQGRFFIDNFERNVPSSLNELKERIENGNTAFVNHLTFWSNRIKGSNAYWNLKRNELYSWINQHIELGNGAPMFFITLSCAEYFWPDIVDLIRDRLKLAHIDDSDCYAGSPKLVQLVNDYSIVIQEYFQRRTELWLNTVGKEIFGIDHYWVRYEFAPGRGQIHAHLLAISRYNDIYADCYTVLKEKNGETTRAELLSEWAESTFGLTACVDDGFDEIEICSKKSPVSIRFSDINENDESIHNDGQRLLKFCQTHTCSKFCLRNGNANK